MDANTKKTLGKVLVGVLITGIIGTAGFFGYKFYMKKKGDDSEPEIPAAIPEIPAAIPEIPAAIPEIPAAIPEIPTGNEVGTRNLNAITDPKLKTITEKLIKDAKFDSVSDAQYFMDKLQNVPGETRPNSDQIKAGLRNSNMAFYDGKAEKRLTFWEVDKMNQQNLLKSKAEGWAMMRYNGGFGSPDLNKYTTYQLKRLLAHGWWIGLSQFGNGFKMGVAEDGGNAYYAGPMDLGKPSGAAQENGWVYSMVTIPSSVKGEEYSYAFSGFNARLV